jgi:hypothetical protein
MPKSQKQKTSMRKRTTTKKKKKERTYGIDVLDDASEERVSIISMSRVLKDKLRQYSS